MRIGLLLSIMLTSPSVAQDMGGLGGLGDLLGVLGGGGAGTTCPSACSSSGGSSSTSSHEQQHNNHHHLAHLATTKEKDGRSLLSPAPKERIRPYSNGCSVPPALRDGLGDYSHFESCCDLHDTCYMTCGASKEFCDKDFGKCMKLECRRRYRDTDAQAMMKDCRAMADMFVLGVSMFGCGGYTSLQREGCDCLDPTEAAQRVHVYAKEFYRVYNGTHPLPENILSKYFDQSLGHTQEARERMHGELLYRLYKRYPESIDIISRDGQSGRSKPVYFDVPRQHTSHAGGL